MSATTTTRHQQVLDAMLPGEMYTTARLRSELSWICLTWHYEAVFRALTVLEKQGFVTRRKGKGRVLWMRSEDSSG